MGNDCKQRIIETNRYQPTEDQKAQAYRPIIQDEKGYTQTLKMPGDIVIGIYTMHIVN